MLSVSSTAFGSLFRDGTRRKRPQTHIRDRRNPVLVAFYEGLCGSYSFWIFKRAVDQRKGPVGCGLVSHYTA
jgi:hypothetical protein